MVWGALYGTGDRWLAWIPAAGCAFGAALFVAAGSVVVGPRGVRPGMRRRWIAWDKIVEFCLSPPVNEEGKRVMPGVGAVLKDGSYASLVGVAHAGDVEELVGLISEQVATSRHRAATDIIERLTDAMAEFRR